MGNIMTKFESFLDKTLTPAAGWVASNKVLSSIAAGMIMVMPFTLIASIFSIASALPDMLPFLPAFSAEVKAAILLPYNFIFGSLALFVVFAVAYQYAKKYNLHQVNCGLISLAVFFVIASRLDGRSFDGTYFGYAGIFTAILIAVLVVQLYKFVLAVGLKIKMPDQVPPNIKDSFEAFLPFTIVMIVFYLVSLAFQAATGQRIPDAVAGALTGLVQASDTLGFIWGKSILQDLFYWLGMHGWTLVDAPLMAITQAKLAENAAAYAVGDAMPYIIAGGWSLGTIAKWLIPVCILLFCKAKRNRTIGKMAIIPSVFIITEPYLFGLPIVMNPILLVPFVLSGTIANVISYIAIDLGWMNRAFAQAAQVIPQPFAAFLSNGDWRTFIIAIPTILIIMAMWYPFLKVWDKKCLQEEAEVEAALAETGDEKA